MTTKLSKLLSLAGAIALAFAVVPSTSAQCGLPNHPFQPDAWQLQPGSNPFNDDDHDDGAAITGMWHVLFTAASQNGQPIPNGGAVIDNAIVVWHPDGTEIMNSSRSAQDGNFCLGVWRRTGPRTFLLNHIPWRGNVYDPTVPPDLVGPPQDGVQLIEHVTLSPDCNSYSGTFTLTAYDTGGNIYLTFTGTLSAKRVTPDTPFRSLL